MCVPFTAPDGHSYPGFQSVHRQRPLCYIRRSTDQSSGNHVLITWGRCVALSKSPYFRIMRSLGVCPFWRSFQCLISTSPSNVLRGQCGKSCGVEQTLKKHLWLNEWMNERRVGEWGAVVFQFPRLPSLENRREAVIWGQTERYLSYETIWNTRFYLKHCYCVYYCLCTFYWDGIIWLDFSTILFGVGFLAASINTLV